MIDWRTVGRWDVPGAKRFLDKVSATINSGSGAACLHLPIPYPSGILDAVEQHVRSDSGLRTLVANASGGLGRRGVAHWLASRAAITATEIRSVSDFLDDTDIADTVFLVYDIQYEDWPAWNAFLRQVRTELTRKARIAFPVVVVVPPPPVTLPEIDAIFGRKVVQWQGKISRLDSRILVDKKLGWLDENDLVMQATASSILEIAGWDPVMIDLLGNLETSVQLNPISWLVATAKNLPLAHPSWQNGLVDFWDGRPFEHSLSLARRGETDALKRRLWRGQVRVLFPFLEYVRTVVVARYYDKLENGCPRTKTFLGGAAKTYYKPEELEYFDIQEILKFSIPHDELMFLRICQKIRGNMAHIDPIPPEVMLDLAKVWEGVSDRFPGDCYGWDWLRCGQKLVVLVGPSGAGKSTWAEQNYQAHEIVSSDAIRLNLHGSQHTSGDQQPVFEELRRRTVIRLQNGQDVVVDATNIKAKDRIANVGIAPPDVPVEYVVIDRPLADKKRTGGWRNDKTGFLEKNSLEFDAQMPAILIGDGRPNVVVIDTRRNTGCGLQSGATG